MSQQLINHSDDLVKLVEEGFELELNSNLLLIKNVPYVNQNSEIQYGTFVSTLCHSGGKTIKPDNHVIYFVGEYPCHKDGREIKQMFHQSTDKNMGNNIIVNHSFSNKPSQGFNNYFEKITHYVNIVSSPAESLDSSVAARKFRKSYSQENDSVFVYADTNSSRAGIDHINEKVKGQKIAIVGLGGTGSYILDLVSKTPVQEIHLFDGDIFEQHNAFRAPGAAENSVFLEKVFKADYYEKTYKNMHNNIYSHPYFINDLNLGELSSMDFVFIAIDKGKIKKPIIETLESNNINYIDVGLDVQIVNNMLLGMIRTTSSIENKREHVSNRISFVDAEDNEYSSNIQIPELNSLNATQAVIKWKKIYGIYMDNNHENHSTYSIDMHQLLGDDYAS